MRSHLFVALLLTSLGATSADVEQRYQKSREDFRLLLSDEKRSKQRTPYENLIKKFNKLEKQDGGGDISHRAAFMSCRVAEELSKASRVPKDLDNAMKMAISMAQKYPNSRLADDALFTAAQMALERRGDQKTARSLLADLIARFPRGDMVGKARELYARLPEPSPPKASVQTSADTAAPAMAHQDPVDRIGELLQKAELIRTEAGEHAPESAGAAVLTAAAELSKAEALTQPGTAEKNPPPPPPPLPELPQATSKRPAKIDRIKIQRKQDRQQVLIRLDASVAIKRGEAQADKKRKLPKRVFFDLTPAKLKPQAREIKGKPKGDLKLVRVGQNTLDTVRIVLELKGDTQVQPPTRCHRGLCITVGEKVEPAPIQQVETQPVAVKPQVGEKLPAAPDTQKQEPKTEKVAVASTRPAANPREVTAATTNRDMIPKKPVSAGMSLSQQVGLSVKTIVIDPGHGGRDPGAIGPTGLREKDVVLKIAKKAAARLREELGVKVILTRKKDRYISLEERAKIANDAKADLFISIHVNASPNRRAYGIETFYLNTTDDRYAIRLAARENKGSEKSIGDLQFILADLVTKSNVDDSRRLAKAVQRNVITQTRKNYRTNIKDLGLKHALFYVLIGVRMPSVLVEASFISNRREEKRLRQDKYLNSIADGVVRGVREFTESQKAPGS